MTRSLSLLLVVALAGCVHAPPRLAPQQLTVATTPTDVLSVAARSLVDHDFEITYSDASAGILQARRVRGPKGNDGYLACGFNRFTVFGYHLQSTLALTVAATSAGDSTAVRVSTNVTAAYPTMTDPARPENDKDCASTGVVESDIVAAIRARAGGR